jgi:uncharacterized phage-associated protein
MPTVFEVADYILAKYQSMEEFADDPMTHMKLQKLAYYAQCYHLHRTGEPLFPERIEAWEHGPVCPDLDESYSSLGRAAIMPPGLELAKASSPFSGEQISSIGAALAMFGGFSAMDLSRISHQDKAWSQARQSGEKTIGRDALMAAGKKHLTVQGATLNMTGDDELEAKEARTDEPCALAGGLELPATPRGLDPQGLLAPAMHLIIATANDNGLAISADLVNKAIFLAERRNRRSEGAPLLGANILKGPDGPVPEGHEAALRSLIESGKVAAYGGGCRSLEAPDPALLTGKQREALEFVARGLSADFFAWELSRMTDGSPIWRKAEMGDELPVNMYFEEQPELTPQEVDELRCRLVERHRGGLNA